MPTFYEFFAGGGMARAGLGDKWTCLFANDFDVRKSAAYIANWGKDHLLTEDLAKVAICQIPPAADLAWASFPCQDLSLAGVGAGLGGDRSGTFWLFLKLIRQLNDEYRGPRIVVLENVCGALSSHDGQDFVTIGSALTDCGYSFGAMIIDAKHFVPQSRPRLFLVGVRSDIRIPEDLTTSTPDAVWHPIPLLNAHKKLAPASQKSWIWWRMPIPPGRSTTFSEVIEDNPKAIRWHTSAETQRLLSLMGPLHRDKVEEAKRSGRRTIGCVYRRTRKDKNGVRVQRAEIRLDDMAGCLRTPKGGSSRQSILVIEGDRLRSRLISPREAARLMGLPDAYLLPKKYNEAYHLAGDGVAVPVVRFLAEHLLEPILTAANNDGRPMA